MSVPSFALALIVAVLYCVQDSEEGDYDPDKDDPGSADDEVSEEDETGEGPSSSKRPKLEPQQEESESTDSD